MGKLELTPCDFIIEVGAACIILRQITQLLFKTLNISFKLVGIDGRQIASALGENGHDIVRNLGIAAGHGKRVVDSAHGLIGNANVTAVDRADLAGVSRQDAKLAIRGRNRHMAPAESVVRSALRTGSLPPKGVTVTQEGGKLVIALHIKVGFGLNISTITQSITHRVKDEVELATGLKVARIDVYVDDVIAD